MWVPTWIVWAAPLAWVVKIWLFDVPAENRAAIVRAEQEKRETAQYHENLRRGDRILEDLVKNGAPVCLLSVRRTSDRPIDRPTSEWMNPTETLRSYEKFHEAMKLFEDD